MQADNRMRAWYGPGMQRGLLYTCSMGDIRPDAPCALLVRHGSGEAAREDIILMEQQAPAQREQVHFFIFFVFRGGAYLCPQRP